MEEGAGIISKTVQEFFVMVKHPVKFRLFLLRNLPAAYFSGLKLVELSAENCSITIPYKWFTRNPFRSTYFACLSMAAEMSTGTLAMANVYRRSPKVSLLVVAIEGKFIKKATGLTRFTCNQGQLIRDAVEKAINLSAPQSVRVASSGYNEKGELVAEFFVTWSFKAKS